MDTMTPMFLALPDFLSVAVIRLLGLLSGKHTGLKEVVQNPFPQVHGKLTAENEESRLEMG